MSNVAFTLSPSYKPFILVLGFFGALVGFAFLSAPPEEPETIHLAMIGNSMMYYNDLPRVLVAMSGGDDKLKQDSCLHGGATFETHLTYGNGMYPKWKTGQARIWSESSNFDDDDTYTAVYDYGACTPIQLLLGYDERLAAYVGADDDGENQEQGDDYFGMDDTFNYDDGIVPDDEEYENSYDKNPCYVNQHYYQYVQQKYWTNPPQWDYVLMNDSTRSACCTDQRETSMHLLKNVYVPLFLETGATPIFMMTYAYNATWKDISGLGDIATWTSYNYAGYKAYAELVGEFLPKSQKPRIAPVGLAFLLIYEEYPEFWEKLIHYDQIHCSPRGTYLEGLIVYATIHGKLPDPEVVMSVDGTAHLWKYARRMVPDSHQMKPFPSISDATYLYHIASRIVQGEKPKSLTKVDISQSLDFTPNDDAYQDLNVYGELVY